MRGALGQGQACTGPFEVSIDVSDTDEVRASYCRRSNQPSRATSNNRADATSTTAGVYITDRGSDSQGVRPSYGTLRGPFTGSGLWVLEVDHDGNRNASDEEVETVADLVAKLTTPGSQWIDEHGVASQMTADQILVVAPYNAQVSRLDARLKDTGARVGTVDKFQGQQAPVVIYSMATSRLEDAPRGLEFLYSLNRLNVATSRAQCAVILVASPRLFVPDCSTPRQMNLTNALCRYHELAQSARPRTS